MQWLNLMSSGTVCRLPAADAALALVREHSQYRSSPPVGFQELTRLPVEYPFAEWSSSCAPLQVGRQQHSA